MYIYLNDSPSYEFNDGISETTVDGCEIPPYLGLGNHQLVQRFHPPEAIEL